MSPLMDGREKPHKESRLPTWREAVAAGDVQKGDYMTYLRVPCRVDGVVMDASGEISVKFKDLTTGESFTTRC